MRVRWSLPALAILWCAFVPSVMALSQRTLAANLAEQDTVRSPISMLWHLNCEEPLDAAPAARWCMLEVDFDEPISVGSVETFRRVLGYGESAFAALPLGGRLEYRAVLNSPGGDVSAALELGRLLREKSADADVDQGQECASACVLALIGGPARRVDGKVGIHRPYLDFDTKAPVPASTQIQASTNRVRDQMIAYLAEMNIPRKIVDDMMLIPPETIEWLDHRDLAKYGIFAFDPVHNEEEDLRVSREFGLSRDDYMKRKISILQYCFKPSPDDPFENFNLALTFKTDSCAGPIMAAPPGKMPRGVRWEYSKRNATAFIAAMGDAGYPASVVWKYMRTSPVYGPYAEKSEAAGYSRDEILAFLKRANVFDQFDAPPAKPK